MRPALAKILTDPNFAQALAVEADVILIKQIEPHTVVFEHFTTSQNGSKNVQSLPLLNGAEIGQPIGDVLGHDAKLARGAANGLPLLLQDIVDGDQVLGMAMPEQIELPVSLKQLFLDSVLIAHDSRRLVLNFEAVGAAGEERPA